MKLCRTAAVVVFLLGSVWSLAQTVTGTLSGRATDSSGAVITGALITAHNAETGLLRETKTNAEGYYTLPFIPIGTYEVTFSQPGFKIMKKTDVIVALNNTTVTDMKMEPATVAEVISVTAEPPQVDTTSGEVKTTLSSLVIEERPLPSRNILTLAETVPGYQDNAVSGQNNPTVSSGSSANFNGVGTRGTTFQIDGVNNDDYSENQNRQNVNLDAIAEVQVLTNNFSAEFGRGYGAVMLVQTKQGTNAYHGSAFGYEINSPWGFANSYYNNHAGTQLSSWRRHDFGGTVGGPIKTNKLFFFGSYEGVRNGGGRSSTYSVLLPNERTPDVSVTDSANRAFIQSIIDRFPSVTPNKPNLCPTAATVTGSIDGKKYSKTPPCRVYTMPIKYSYPSEDVSGRVDWNISTKNTFTSRYQWSRQQTDPGTDWIKGQGVGYNNIEQNLGLTLTHIFSDVQVGEARLAIGRRETQANVLAGNDTPIFRFGGTYGSIIGNAGNFPILRYQTDWQFVYNHRYGITNKLTLRMGTDIRPSQLNDLSDNFTRGYWSMGSAGWVQTAAGDNFEYRDGYYNFLRGIMTGGSYTQAYGPARLGNRLKEANFYFQADYRITPSVTINLGVRDEYVRAPREVNHLVDYGYGDINSFSPRIGFAFSPEWSDGFIAKVTGGPGKSVIRGGFGIFAGRWFQSAFSQGGASIRFNPPNAASVSFTMSNATNIADPTGGYVFTPGEPNARISVVKVDPNLTLPYSEQWNLTVERQLPSTMGLSLSYVGNRGIGLPFYNITNRARFPFTSPPANQWSATDQANGTAAKFGGVTYDCIDPNLASTSPIKINGHQCISLNQLYVNYRRPNEKYGAINEIKNAAWSYYHSAQILLTKRPTHGVNFQAAYTFAKAIDTGSEMTTTNIDTNTPFIETDTAAGMRGYSLFDTRHRFSIAYGYELPFFAQQQGFLGRILGGWSWSGTTLWATGDPFSITAGYDLNGDGVNNDLATIVDPSVYGKSINNGHYIQGTNNTYSMYQIPATALYPNNTQQVATMGSAFNPGLTNKGLQYRNSFRAAGRNNFDMAVTKRIRVREGQALMVRVDAYNVMNHAQFDYPTRSSTSADFGRISGQRDNRGYFTDGFGGSRFLQLAMRYQF